MALVAAIAAAVWWKWGVHLLTAYLLAVNLATFLLYGYDKAAAASDRTRVPEVVLHLLAVIGGSPTALASQKLFRHKTVKSSFQRVFWLIVVVQVLILACLWWTAKT